MKQKANHARSKQKRAKLRLKNFWVKVFTKRIEKSKPKEIKGIPFEDDLQKLFESAYKTMTRTDIDIDSEMLKLLTKYVGKTAAQAMADLGEDDEA